MRRIFILCAVAGAVLVAADVRPVPPPGVAIPEQDRNELQAELKKLDAFLAQHGSNPLLPDVRIFTEAVRYALDYNEFFKPEEAGKARELLAEGRRRAEALAQGKTPWLTATGLVVRGYVSKIDGSVQPYGLVIPAGYAPVGKWRVDTWFHGRGETLSEVNFLWDRLRNPGEFTPAGTIVLHLYGRYCNANKFAGEVDLFEALDHVKRFYPVDENRIVVRGFSMGGAATWHIAAHYAGLWAGAAPGAGFAETAEFTNLAKSGPKPEWWEQKLFHWYDATDYALNLFNTSVVAYSGEIDKQKQAADIMARALEAEGMRLTHIIGPNTAHKYHPDSKVVISRIVDSIAERGRDPYPRKVRFTTWTLRYNRMKWIVVDGLEHHWDRARIEAEIEGDNAVNVKTSGVTAFSIDMGPGGCPLDAMTKTRVVVDGTAIPVSGPMSDRSWTVHVVREGGKWTVSERAGAPGLAKRHALQGPIDDAFMDRFIFVKPTGAAQSEAVAKWALSEQDRAVREWRRQFRGEARVRTDAEITDDDIASSNLVLWGDPASNRVLARIIDKLPLRWTATELSIAGKRFDAATNAPVLIYPNPLNPSRYVVINSGFTFRERDYLNNANQVARLPDYAVVDVTTAPDARWPGRIALPGFFDERWR